MRTWKMCCVVRSLARRTGRQWLRTLGRLSTPNRSASTEKRNVAKPPTANEPNAPAEDCRNNQLTDATGAGVRLISIESSAAVA